MQNTVSTPRDLTLDFVKGILVVFMVVYHVMNIFSTVGWEAYSYIRFVSGSFLFISGYIISLYSEQRFHTNRMGMTRRLVERSLKLFLIFTVLNLVINLTGVGNPSKGDLGAQNYLSKLFDIYVFGLPKAASFQVLLPIAYVLLISPLFLLLSSINNVLILASLAAAFFLSYFEIESVNFGLGIVGVIGLCSGMFVNKSEVAYALKSKTVIVGCLLACFFLMKYFDRNIVTYSLGIIFFIKLFYDLGKIVHLESLVNQVVILFGQYSLVCYIVQIIFLQLLSLMLSRQKWDLGVETILMFFGANIFLFVICVGIKFLRPRYRFIDLCYRFIFS
jgi:hypothetical protein